MAEQITVTSTKLRRDLGAVLDAVTQGATVHVTRQGRALCTIIPPGQAAPAEPNQAPTSRK